MTRPAMWFGRTMLLLLLVTGCSSLLSPDRGQPVEATLSNVTVVNGVRVTLSVDPAQVKPTQSFIAHLELQNTGQEAATWTNGYGCLAFLHVYRNGKRIPFQGTDFACIAVVRSWQIPPGESIKENWSVRAQRMDGQTTRPGKYRFVVETGSIQLEHELLVK